MKRSAEELRERSEPRNPWSWTTRKKPYEEHARELNEMR